MKIISSNSTSSRDKLSPSKKLEQREARRRGLVFGAWVQETIENTKKRNAVTAGQSNAPMEKE